MSFKTKRNKRQHLLQRLKLVDKITNKSSFSLTFERITI